jgi:hypothetical protein
MEVASDALRLVVLENWARSSVLRADMVLFQQVSKGTYRALHTSDPN